MLTSTVKHTDEKWLPINSKIWHQSSEIFTRWKVTNDVDNCEIVTENQLKQFNWQNTTGFNSDILPVILSYKKLLDVVMIALCL